MILLVFKVWKRMPGIEHIRSQNRQKLLLKEVVEFLLFPFVKSFFNIFQENFFNSILR